MRSRTVRTMAGLAVAAIVLAGCQSMQNMSKEDLGMLIGGVTGGLVGTQIGGGRGRVLATVIAAAAGAWIGNRIGRHLDAADRERLAVSTHQAAATGRGNSWSNPDTGVRSTVRVKNSTTRGEKATVPVLKAKVQDVPPLDFIGAPYAATGKVNVRGGPGTDYVVVDNLARSQRVEVVGKVRGKPWYLIAQNGVGSGFVHQSLLRPLRDAAPEPMLTGVSALLTPGVEQKDVSANRTCRVIEQEVRLASGEVLTEEVRACNGPNGWEIA